MSKTALYLWLLLLIIIIGGTATYITKYYHEFEVWETKDAIAWGLMVPSYVYFALASTGSSIINSI